MTEPLVVLDLLQAALPDCQILYHPYTSPDNGEEEEEKKTT